MWRSVPSLATGLRLQEALDPMITPWRYRRPWDMCEAGDGDGRQDGHVGRPHQAPKSPEGPPPSRKEASRRRAQLLPHPRPCLYSSRPAAGKAPRFLALRLPTGPPPRRQRRRPHGRFLTQNSAHISPPLAKTNGPPVEPKAPSIELDSAPPEPMVPSIMVNPDSTHEGPQESPEDEEEVVFRVVTSHH